MKRNWSDIEPSWLCLCRMDSFDMSVPCVVIDSHCELKESTVSGVSTHLKVSAAMSAPLVKKYIMLSSRIGSNKAMETMLADLDTDVEEFSLLWSEAKRDVEQGAIASMDDLVAAIATAKKGFRESPRRILVVQINKHDCDLLLVGQPNDENRWL